MFEVWAHYPIQRGSSIDKDTDQNNRLRTRIRNIKMLKAQIKVQNRFVLLATRLKIIMILTLYTTQPDKHGRVVLVPCKK